MSKAIVLGTPGMIEQPRRFVGGPFKTLQIVRSWRGSKKSALDMIPQIAGYDFTITESGPNSLVEVIQPSLPNGDPTAEVPTDNWELLPGEIEKDVLEANIAVSNALTIADKEKLRNALKDNVHAATSSFSSAAQAANVADLQELMFEGLKSVETSLPVLQLTRITSSSYTVVYSQANCDLVLTTATLYRNEVPPINFLIAFDVAPYNVTASVRNRLNYGWLKKRPTLTTMSGGRIQIVQHFKFGLWPTLIYGAPV